MIFLRVVSRSGVQLVNLTGLERIYVSGNRLLFSYGHSDIIYELRDDASPEWVMKEVFSAIKSMADSRHGVVALMFTLDIVAFERETGDIPF